MAEKTILLPSATQAMYSKNILQSAGIRSRLTRYGGRGFGGCGYALAVNYADFSRAAELLKRRGVRFEI